ncbi:hypothetical protein D8674_035625 [Pyrus ussuriensis x Pyrus communis]|uniref:Uncharacterized protein n=1 Tax=Pyrus ussuriensis x Pyrus communis TaxID=2448454 RepID=A0A5N5GCV8_9ROSA|nr:hypothetical protein D8674_035625 [Pyrus ussuriensis x Pyrus communis]
MTSDIISESMQFVLGTDEFEDFEVTEVDGALLRDLLEELEEEEEEEKNNEKLGFVVQSSVGADEANNMTTDGQVSLEHDGIEICIPDSKWEDIDMVETDPLYEMGAWFRDDDMVGMVDCGSSIGDYAQLQHSGFGGSYKEITYNCLWEDN